MYDVKFDELKLTNDFIFAKVMRNTNLCKKMLEVILNLTIDHIEYFEEQKTIDLTLESKSVRLDVYAKDDKNTIYNVEMQVSVSPNLPKRSRYYQDMIDLSLLEKGDDYTKLNRSYIIFICTEDVFGFGRCIYTFKNICVEEPTLMLGDETIKVFLNASSTADYENEDLTNFLHYLSTGTPMDDFTMELEKAVETAKINEEWRREYMTLHMKEQEIRREALEEGMEQGREEGMLLLCKLIEILISANRLADVKLASTDATERNRLLREFELIG